MKLNEKGKALYNVWYENYCRENDKLGGNSAEGDFIDGWGIIDTYDYVKNITDECGVLIFAYDDDALYMVDKWLIEGVNMGESLGLTLGGIRNELLKYFE